MNERSDRNLEARRRSRRWLFLVVGTVMLLTLAYLAMGSPSWALQRGRSLRETIPAEVHGSVVWERCNPAPAANYAVPVRVSLFFTDGVLHHQGIYTTTTTGTFIMPGVDPYTYTVTAKGYHTLRVRLNNVVVVTPSTTISLGTMPEGDCNDDNVVNAADQAILNASYGKSHGQVGFDARADLDENGVVDARDAALLSNHFGQTGAANP